MIYLTQLIYIKPSQEQTFHQFEDLAIPLMEKYGGRIIHRLRPDNHCFISGDEEKPYEIHFMSFPSENHLQDFLSDPERQNSLSLKEASIQSSFLVKGSKM